MGWVLARARAGGAALGAARRTVLSDAVRAWGLSRALCWVAGVAGVLVLGAHPGPHDPARLTSPFGGLGDKLVAPAARWDSMWYLLIADHGYVSRLATKFYPLYPWSARVAGAPLGSSLIGGILVSLGALMAALYLLQRLVTLELGPVAGRRTMCLLAFFPTAVFFSAVYTEGLFLALSIGAFYAARTSRWTWAGIAGGLATLTRPTGIVLVIPLVLLYLYGPRPDRPQRPAGAGPPGARGWRERLAPQHRVHPDALWLLGVPAGLGCFMAYLQLRFGDPFVMLEQGAAWHQTFTFPLLTAARASARAVTGAGQVLHGHAPSNVYEFAFFCLACVGTVGALRRLPIAYGAYALAGVVFLLSFPIAGESLSGFSRYLAPLFPVLMWVTIFTAERRRFYWVLGAFALAMVINSVRFATWHFVA